MATKNKIEKPLEQRIKDKMDGRTQRWLSQKTGISEDKLSNKFTGITAFTEDDIKVINEALGADFKL
jgi:hypothetical protein